MTTVFACFVTMLITAFFFSAVSLTKIKESDAEAAKWKALADYEAAEKHRALNDLNAERLAREAEKMEPPVKNAAIDKPTAEEIAAAREIVRQQGGCRGVWCFCCPANGKHGDSKENVGGPSPHTLSVARAWLASHGLPVEEPKEAKA